MNECRSVRLDLTDFSFHRIESTRPVLLCLYCLKNGLCCLVICRPVGKVFIYVIVLKLFLHNAIGKLCFITGCVGCGGKPFVCLDNEFIKSLLLFFLIYARKLGQLCLYPILTLTKLYGTLCR